MTKLEFDEMDNVALESNARNLHGALYHRINTLQRDLNIARESINKQMSFIASLEEENKDLRKLAESRKQPEIKYTKEQVLQLFDEVTKNLFEMRTK
jgi:predicted  nucleic acid-binding Zn-ribbon protein